MATLDITAAKVESELHAVRDDRKRRVEGSPLGLGLQRLYEDRLPRPPVRATGDRARRGSRAHRREGGAQVLPRALRTCERRAHRGRKVRRRATLERVRKRFDAVPRRATPALATATLAPQQGERRATRRVATSTPVVMVGWRGPADADADGPALELLARIVSKAARRRGSIAPSRARRVRVLFTQGTSTVGARRRCSCASPP